MGLEVPRSRVAIIGFDSLDFDLVRQWADEGQLPTFRALLDRGAWSRVTNPRGFEAGACWWSMVSGTQPDVHGIYDAFYKLDPESYAVRVVRPDEIPVSPFWTTASLQGRRVAIIDVPYSFPDSRVNGLHVVDWLVHVRSSDQRIQCNSPELERAISESFGLNPFQEENRCPINEQEVDSPAGLQRVVDILRERATRKGRFALQTLSQGNWDLFFVVFHEAHDVGHMCWHAHDTTHPRHRAEVTGAVGDPLLAVYRHLDAETGRLLEAMPPDTMPLVYTSHGIGPERTASRFLDLILQRLELSAAPAKASTPSRTARLWAATRGVVPSGLRHRLRRTQLARGAYRRDVAERLHKRRCFALNPSYATGGIKLNVIGRERHGIVEPGAGVDALLADLTEAFLEMTNADTGEPLVESVTRLSDLYSGPLAHALPDLLLEWNKSHPIDRVSSPRFGVVQNPKLSARSGDHFLSKHGALFVGGSAGHMGRQADVAVTDIAPTLGAIVGFKSPDYQGATVSFVAAAGAATRRS